MKLVECIPNFSEGKDKEVISKLVAVAQSFGGVTLLDYSSDENHNRSVFTLLGEPEALLEAVFALVKLASEVIDLTKHTGEHPRMGATDVVPFVPIKNIEMCECVELSKRLGERIARELNIPVYLYEQSATTNARTDLANVRKGQFEGFFQKIKLPEWAPDYGTAQVHRTAGCTAVCARTPLVAFNINLSTSDLDVAKSIAKVLRGSSGGLKYCKAIGVMLKDRNVAQVSMNMVNFEGTPLYRVVELAKIEAARFGVNVIGTELIGLAPAKALIDCAEYYLRIENFDYNRQVLEIRY